MSSLVTKEAPDFTAQAVMPNNTFEELKLSSYRGKYVVLFFYPLDFTFVCPSEIIAFDKKLAEFREKNDGKSPNIVYILIDDMGLGDMGI